MSEEYFQESAPLSDLGDTLPIDSALSILVAESAGLNIDPQKDNLTTLADALLAAITEQSPESLPIETLLRCRDLLCAILFEMENLGLTNLANLPLSELQSHLLTLSISPNTESSVELVISETNGNDQVADEEIRFSTELSDQIWNTGKIFTDPSSIPSQLSDRDRRRLANLYTCSAIELESSDKLQSAIRKLWPLRDSIIQPMIASDPGKISLADPQKKIVAEIEAAFGNELPASRIPVGAMMAALRLILAKKGEDYRPSLIESATLFLFLGGHPDNLIAGPTREHCVELSVKLIRLHKLKQLCLDFTALEPPDPSATFSDARISVALLQQIVEPA